MFWVLQIYHYQILQEFEKGFVSKTELRTVFKNVSKKFMNDEELYQTQLPPQIEFYSS